jgi:hypothetical protein
VQHPTSSCHQVHHEVNRNYSTSPPTSSDHHLVNIPGRRGRLQRRFVQEKLLGCFCVFPLSHRSEIDRVGEPCLPWEHSPAHRQMRPWEITIRAKGILPFRLDGPFSCDQWRSPDTESVEESLLVFRSFPTQVRRAAQHWIYRGISAGYVDSARPHGVGALSWQSFGFSPSPSSWNRARQAVLSSPCLSAGALLPYCPSSIPLFYSASFGVYTTQQLSVSHTLATHKRKVCLPHFSLPPS